MNIYCKYIVLFFSLAFAEILSAQTTSETLKNVLSFEEYLGYVKTHHPLMKQAELTLSMGEAETMKARGAFDPKIEVDYDRKKFKNSEYYDQLNATFKIPTWYGIELKANFEDNTGEFLNPNLTVPEGGLYGAGISFSLAQGFLINERMASLKQAKFFRDQTKQDRELLVSNLLYEASSAYFDWIEATNELEIYETFRSNAEVRLKAVERSVEVGETAAIDITEARIVFENRLLDLEAANLKRRKAALVASNYLWLNSTPLEIQDNVVPELPSAEMLEASLVLENNSETLDEISNHPKLLSMDAKINSLEVDRSLKRNKLLPKLDIQYNFLTPEFDPVTNFNTANYKAFVNFSLPIFLRKERGDLRLANLKLQGAQFERTSTSLSLLNKITEKRTEIASLKTQNTMIRDIVEDYVTLVEAEERKFFLGESSLFLINSREQKLIDVRLKENTLQVKRLSAIAQLYNVLGTSVYNLNN